MVYLLLAILSSVMVSVIMRLSSDKITNNVAMLAMNYLMCTVIAGMYTGPDRLFCAGDGGVLTLGMGVVHGALYLASFMLLQLSINKNGVVLSATFMKLGLLVPMVISTFIFREKMTFLQVVGFCIAISAIVLINMEKEQTAMNSQMVLLLLLLLGGMGDAMSKVFEELGNAEFSSQFLVYTFIAAFLLCMGLMLAKGQRPGKTEILYGMLIGIPNYYSARFLLLSLKNVAAVIAYPTYSAATLMVLTLIGVIAFKEKIGKKQWLAICLILAALVLLNL